MTFNAAIKSRLNNSAYWLLEAISRSDGERRSVLSDVAGMPEQSVYWASQRLIHYGAIVRLSGQFFITERGRIVLALARGKQERKRNAVGRSYRGFDNRYADAGPR